MSPEQARNEEIDHRTDLYSVAVCLYEALTAERLFVGDLSTPAEVLYGQPIVPPSQKRKVLPKALDAVLAKALAPKPGRSLSGRGRVRRCAAPGRAPARTAVLGAPAGRAPAPHPWAQSGAMAERRQGGPVRRSFDAEDPGARARGQRSKVNRCGHGWRRSQPVRRRRRPTCAKPRGWTRELAKPQIGSATAAVRVEVRPRRRGCQRRHDHARRRSGRERKVGRVARSSRTIRYRSTKTKPTIATATGMWG